MAMSGAAWGPQAQARMQVCGLQVLAPAHLKKSDRSTSFGSDW